MTKFVPHPKATGLRTEFPSWQVEIFEKYPDLFQDVTKSPQETCMCWGLECQEGWAQHLDYLFGYFDQFNKKGVNWSLISKSTDKPVLVKSGKIVLEQVKEKYGELRVYLSFDWSHINEKDFSKAKLEDFQDTVQKEIYTIVRFVEYMCSRTCELTGKPGKLRSDIGWWRVLCDEEYQKILAKRTIAD
jgi:hypothetical protein